jgi:hypothetical protein
MSVLFYQARAKFSGDCITFPAFRRCKLRSQSTNSAVVAKRKQKQRLALDYKTPKSTMKIATKVRMFLIAAATLGIINAAQTSSYSSSGQEDASGRDDTWGQDDPLSNGTATPTNTIITLSNSTPNCSNYQHSVRLDSNFVMFYVVNVPTNGTISDPGTISIKLEYTGSAWIALGVSTNGGSMIGSVPDRPIGPHNPGEYSLNSMDNSGIVLRSSNLQTLRNGSITQANGTTTAVFVKQLSEPGKLPINGSGENTFIWAYGYSSTLSVHHSKGAFTIPHSPCTAKGTTVGGGGRGTTGGGGGGLHQMDNRSGASSSSGCTDDQMNPMWAVYASLAFAVWPFLGL